MSCSKFEDEYEEERSYSYCHTQYEECKGSLLWDIESFSLCPCELGEFVTSPDFGIAGEKENSWNLRLYPKGRTVEGKDCVAVFLHSKRELKEIEKPPKNHVFIPSNRGLRETDNPPNKTVEMITFEISIIDDSGVKKGARTNSCIFNLFAGWGRFISRRSVFGDKDLLLPRDTLTVCCELTVVKKLTEMWRYFWNRPEIFCGEDHGISRDTETKSRRRSQQTLADDMGRLLEDVDVSPDLIIKIGNSTEKFPAHKVVLMARSPVFAATFKKYMRESKIVTIKDVEVQVFRELLSYLYTNQCKLTNVQFAIKLLAAADKYNILSLKTLCADYLEKNLTEKNVFDVVLCADKFGESRLRKRCFEMISSERSNLNTADADWKTKLRSSPEVLQEILQLLAEKKVNRKNVKSSMNQAHCNVKSESASEKSRLGKRKGILMWKISGFSLCPLETGENIPSPSFGLSDQKKMFLDVYPNGISEDCKGFLSVHVFSRTDDISMVQCEVSIINEETAFSQKLPEKEYSFKPSLGWDRYISREELLGDGSSALSNDELIISCNLDYQDQKLPNDLSAHPAASSDLKVNSLTQDIGSLLEQSEFADVELRVRNARIPAHKVVLVARSQVFASKLMEGENVIKDIKEDILRELLRFMYTDQCRLKDVSYAMEVLKAATKCEIPGLQQECVEYLKGQLSVENFYDIIILAFTLREMGLYNYCLNYACLRNVRRSLSFLPWRKSRLDPHPEIVRNILDRAEEVKTVPRFGVHCVIVG